MTKDLISNMLAKIKNANLVKHNSVTIPYSKCCFSILKIFLKHGYINDLQIILESSKRKEIKIFLKYKGWWIRKSLFTVIKRTSTSGKRTFSDYKNLYKKVNSIKTFQGIAIISTSSGVMTHIKANKYKKGGEILCYIE